MALALSSIRAAVGHEERWRLHDMEQVPFTRVQPGLGQSDRAVSGISWIQCFHCLLAQDSKTPLSHSRMPFFPFVFLITTSNSLFRVNFRNARRK